MFILAGLKAYPQSTSKSTLTFIKEISGVVRDSLNNPIQGATVILETKSDTLKLHTSDEEIFIFERVPSGNFVITVSVIGYRKFIKKFSYNTTPGLISLEPIIIENQSVALKEVKISGTPTITYKTDTVEYVASDYQIHKNDNVDELLAKMQGTEVSQDGKLSYQGEQVKKAKLNGKDFAGGDVAQAIKSLPADIVSKIQIVNDFGEQANLTGLRTGAPTLSLNIVTKIEKSVGVFSKLDTGNGTKDRYRVNGLFERIHCNDQIGFIGTANNIVTNA